MESRTADQWLDVAYDAYDANDTHDADDSDDPHDTNDAYVTDDTDGRLVNAGVRAVGGRRLAVTVRSGH